MVVRENSGHVRGSQPSSQFRGMSSLGFMVMDGMSTLRRGAERGREKLMALKEAQRMEGINERSNKSRRIRPNQYLTKASSLLYNELQRLP